MKNKSGLKGFLKGFLYAFYGIKAVICEERNMRVHLAFALNVLFLSPFLGVSKTEYALLLIMISVVLSLEMLNSAIENLCDRITKEKDELIGKIKDIAAGSVLVSAFIAVIIGVIILYRPTELCTLFVSILQSPLYLTGLLIFETMLIIFIIKPKFKNKKDK